MARHEGDFAFYCQDCNRSKTGMIVFHYKRTDYLDPPHMEPVIEVENLGPIFDYLLEQFPHGWKIENGKIIAS